MATTPIQFPLINGVRHSFSSIELKFSSTTPALVVVTVGVKSINYSRTRNRTMVRGNHPDPLAKTRGENEYKGDIEVYIAEFHQLMTGLGAGYGDVPFQVFVTYTENGFDTIADVLNGCTIDTTDASNSQGTDPTARKFELNPIKILFNGVDDLKVPLVSPPA